MSEHSEQTGSSVPQYELILPPAAERLEGDEPSVELLGRPDIRDKLQEVNGEISRRYAELEAGGGKIKELFRGSTDNGISVAVAQYTGAENPHDPNLPDSRLGYPVAGDRAYVVFACMLDELDELRPDGAPLATTPRELVEMQQYRDGLTLGLKTTTGGVIEMRFPPGERPTIAGRKIVPYPEAALGRRRVEAARKSVQWLVDESIWVSQSAREARRAGKDVEAAAAEQRLRQVDKYYGQRLAEAYNHPEWIDSPPTAEEIVPGMDTWLAAHAEELRSPFRRDREAANLRREAVMHVRERHILDPDEMSAIRDALMPGQVATSPPEIFESYYRSGIGVDGERRVISIALSRHRRARMEASLASLERPVAAPTAPSEG